MPRKFKQQLKFAPIPGYIGGYCALTIFPPGTWMDDDDSYVVFVGGCGVGRAKTLQEAKTLLLKEARSYCHRQIDTARLRMAHYEEQLAQLTKLKRREKSAEPE